MTIMTFLGGGGNGTVPSEDISLESGLETWLIIWGLSSGCATLLACYLLTRYFARGGEGPLAYVTAVFSWFLCFAVCFILPIDLVPGSNRAVLTNIWRVLWWLSQLCSWIIIPIVADYHHAGEFTVRGRLKAAIRFNSLFYLTAGCVLLVVLVIVVAQTGMGHEQLLFALTCTAHIGGLALMIFAEGYGVVELPRALWRASGDREVRLRRVLAKLADVAHEYAECKGTLYQTWQLLDGLSRSSIDVAHPLRPFLEVCRANCPSLQEYDLSDVSFRHLDKLPIVAELEGKELSAQHLVKLNYHVKATARRIFFARGLYEGCIRQAERLERDMRVQAQIPDSVQGWLRKALWHLRHDTLRTLLRVLALVCVALSVLIVISECMVPLPIFSPLGVGLDTMRKKAPALVPIFATLLVTYQMACASMPLFALRIKGFYQMSRRNTGAYSMLFNAMNLMRFWPPEAYNFLLLNKLEDTAFQAFMGPLVDLPLGPVNLTDLVPALTAIMALLTLCNISNVFLRCLGAERLSFTGKLTEEAEDKLREGRMFLDRERRRRVVATTGSPPNSAA